VFIWPLLDEKANFSQPLPDHASVFLTGKILTRVIIENVNEEKENKTKRRFLFSQGQKALSFSSSS
jgi:hypothetical protein